jgi:hypothetical protein
MFFSFHHFGSVERPKLFKRVCFGGAGRSRTRLAAELANVLVSIRRRSVGAEGESSKSSIDDFGFCWCQFASTPANQYSVLVIHFFLLSLIGPVEAGPSSFKRVTPRSTRAKLMLLTAALANGRISVLLATRTGGAECKGMQASTNVIGFLLGQLTSAVAAEYATFLVHYIYSFLRDFLDHGFRRE